ncbi:ATP-binding protein [Limnohabitans sp. 2KL-51]|uniref:ATP-binding protein n=1 Tax=Limnohabitans sp. 2KL-51 TaxID=1977911 RepID=UPI000D364CF2|nr:ATP-binding protein [Limnohabitans sp. 2KL-51]PUE52370.1 AAA family ATPase [Limnohabitans sp. 2KL-51]
MKNIGRQALNVLLQRAMLYPVVTVLGPRQSGKTTLCRMAFPDKPYVNLEQPDVREFAQQDPKAFLAQFPDGAVLDEIQNVPSLLSWIQVLTDADPRKGRFVLTGSHQLQVSAQVTQSLAGRTAVLELLPLSLSELAKASDLPTVEPADANVLMLQGGYPRIHAQGMPPEVMLSDYFATYVERDVRQLINLRHLREFGQCVRLLAGRTGQLLNQTSLGNEVGVSSNTITQWLSILEASFLVFSLAPWSVNIGKRLVKSPKIYFYDVGLACWLLGIKTVEQLQHHPLRGALFENLVVLEVLKSLRNQGLRDPLYFFRDSNGLEIDLLLDHADGLQLVEIKASQTVSAALFKNLRTVSSLLGDRVKTQHLIYGGAERQDRTGVEVLPYGQAETLVLGSAA